MCGIVGIVPKNQHFKFISSELDLFYEMLIADSLRGVDGTGVFGAYKSGNVWWWKVASHPYALAADTAVWSTFKSRFTREFKFVFGHNRKSTVGLNTNENAHPFIVDNIVIIHNGFIANHDSFVKPGDQYVVDSHALAYALSREPHMDVIPKITGAYALVWFDMKTKQLHMVRNDMRPLAVVETASNWLIASEIEMLRWIAARNHISVTNSFLMKSHSLQTYDLASGKWETTTYVPKSTWSSGWSESDFAESYNPTKKTLPNIPDFSIKKSDPASNVILLPDKREKSHVNGYEVGAEVTFVPLRCVEWTHGNNKGWRIEGTGEKGNTPILFKVMMDNENEARRLTHVPKLKGTVTTNLFKDALLVLWLNNIEEYKPALMRTYNGLEMTSLEWANLIHKHKCTRCQAGLHMEDFPLTSVSKELVRIFCPRCVLRAYTLLPEDKQKMIQANHGYDPMVIAKKLEINTQGLLTHNGRPS